MSDERELRVMLEHVVPRLPAAEERMRRVREKVVRRRRRRNALGAAALVGGLAVAGAVVTLPSSDVAVPSPAASAAALPPSAPTPPVTELSRVRFGTLGGLVLRLPRTWQAVGTDSDAAGGPPGSTSFAAPQRLATHQKPCPGSLGEFCAPFARLDREGALLAMSTDDTGTYRGKTLSPAGLNTTDVSPSCWALGGTRQYFALLPAPAGSERIQVRLCLAGTSASRLDEVRTMLASATFETAPAS
ncbi:hypothetical protein [Streptomyces sp. NPDC059979]|uniref:hypothetical protein n=1 Tax=Streptomyces sp. NPDC059979 TaxID=3347021 RepID=UPI00367BE28C